MSVSMSRGAGVALVRLERADAYWAAATWVLSVILFATAVSSHPGLSDASEGVAGISSLGILHAPGYPAYVLAGRAFTLIEPFGSMALRVALFSVLCASLSVVVVQLLARRCGAARWAAALGGLCLAAGAGFWFYAAYTKHDQFSGLMFALALYMLVSWQESPSTGRLVGMAAALAIGLGSSWPLTVLLAPVVLVVLVWSWRTLSLRSLAAATAVGAVLLVGIYGFVMVRASENPALNWGGATTVSRLIDLIDRSDFLPPTSGAGSGSVAPTSTHASLPAGPRADHRGAERGVLAPAAATGGQRVASSGIGAYARMFWRELGIAGFLLAAWGAVASLFWRRRRVSWVLLLAFLINLLGALVTVAPSASSYDVDLVEEGFVLGCMFVLAVWVAIGATDLVARIGGVLTRGREAVGRGGVALSATAGGLAAAAVLVPLVIVGWPVAHRSDNAYADRYAATVFSELPRHAALFVWGSDLNLPLTYRQIVYHERPDVAVVALGALRYPWYREQLSAQLGVQLPRQYPNTVAGIDSVVRLVGARRPAYLDEQATEQLKGTVGFKTVGLVSQVLPGTKVVAPPAADLEQTIAAAEHAAGMPSADWQVWPNSYLAQADYVSVALKAARYAYQQHHIPEMRQALVNVVRIDPTNTTALSDLALLARTGGGSGASATSGTSGSGG